jgi:Tfp pilus assembly protein PilF
MAENPEDRTPKPPVGGPSPEAAAIHVALGAAGASEDAREYLRKQSALADLQIDYVREQDRFELSHLRWRQFSDRMRGLLQVSVALVVLLVLAGIGTLIWNAAGDRALVAEAFTVPPQMAKSGLTGTVLANRVLDKFGEMQSHVSGTLGTTLVTRRDSDEARVEIPDTGISLGELNRYLRAWLGHDTHMAGDLARTKTGLALTLRYNGQPGTTFTGSADDLNALVTKAAEHMLSVAQPYRYADYLIKRKRFGEARAFIMPLASMGTSADQAKAYIAWGALETSLGHDAKAARRLHEAVRLAPNSLIASSWLANAERHLGHDEARYAVESTALSRLGNWRPGNLDPGIIIAAPLLSRIVLAEVRGDYAAAARDWAQLVAQVRQAANPTAQAQAYARDHDLGRARAMAGSIPEKTEDGKPSYAAAEARNAVAYAVRDWRAAYHWVAVMESASRPYPWHHAGQLRYFWQNEAYLAAKLGDIAKAEALIAKTPRDCDRCMRRRGQIAAMAGKMTQAKKDFAIVAARSPHIPFAETDWGEILLRRGKFDAAVAQFRVAHSKGPHFADPLEMWGEALIAENRADLAVAKFVEAAKYAPQWGRLHLKWGEALLWSGHKAQARKQLAIARALYLTAAEKRALRRVSATL